MQSGAALWFNRAAQTSVASSMFIANVASQECGAVEMNGCTGNIETSIFSLNKVQLLGSAACLRGCKCRCNKGAAMRAAEVFFLVSIRPLQHRLG